MSTVEMSTTMTSTAAPSPWESLRRCAVLVGLGVWEALLALWTTFCLVLTVFVVGVWPLMGALRAIRDESARQRRLASEYADVTCPRTDPPWPRTGEGFAGQVLGLRLVLSDRRTWMDLLWLIVNPVVGTTIAAAPLLLVVFGAFGVALLGLWGPFVQHWDNSWYAFIPLTGTWSVSFAAVLGLALLILGVWLARRFVDVYAHWARLVIGRVTSAQLQDRVTELTGSRADAVDMQAADLRRIERDLHDGAQARLVAMGMNIGTAEQLIGTDPEAARKVLQDVRASSAQALDEIRNLVRGIHPPVLADRGLAAALQSLALQCPVEVIVTNRTSERPPLPIEAAMYFSGAELLSNSVKHSGASRIDIDLVESAGVLILTVADNGRGGARLDGGTGLRGIERRLAVFDGTLDIKDRPEAGSTVTVTVPLGGTRPD